MNTNFRDSINDLIWFLDRGYPKKPAVAIVGNKYKLNHQERMILYRGVFETESSSDRKKKLIDPHKAPPQKLLIDGNNVIITISSYLKGLPVFRALDGYVRDVSEVFGRFKIERETRRVIELVADFINNLGEIEYVCIYLDKPVFEGMDIRTFQSYIVDKTKESQQSVVVRVVESVDNEIKQESATDSAAVTSDTEIIDKVVSVIDMPDQIITKVFQGEILDLKDFVLFK
ncbi:MAG: DUF434 domain-containing protein [Spirochaetota bacterium]|nr:MAG: DUF434 domain-containing protein [Spirochaetota bacterium]